MRTMYDAVTAANIPRSAAMVAGYIDKIKLEPWSAADWARFPNAVKVTIVKKASTNGGDVLDVEPGDATPAEAPGWVRMRRAAGADPTVYCNTSTWPSVRAAFRSANTPEPHYWLARYDGKAEWDAGWAAAGVVAKQYGGNVPGGYDLSSVADFWPGVDGEDNMPSVDEIATAVWNKALQNRLSGGWSSASDIVGYGHAEAGWARRDLGQALTDLSLKVAAQQSVPVADLVAGLLAGLLPAVKEDLADVEHLDEHAVADRLAENLAARLNGKPAAGGPEVSQ